MILNEIILVYIYIYIYIYMFFLGGGGIPKTKNPSSPSYLSPPPKTMQPTVHVAFSQPGNINDTHFANFLLFFY